MPKVVDVLRQYEEEDKTFYSFEYFPPKTAQGLKNLEARLERMGNYGPQKPLFLDVTWGAGGSTSDKTIDICTKIQKNWGLANMHITCTNMPTTKIAEGLAAAKAAGIRNIVALRGDPPVGEEKWVAVEGGFTCALDLVKHVRKEYGDYFCIAVAGYPEGHMEAKSVEEDMAYLKKKVDAGADIIITQLFYDTDLYIDWVKKCRAIGIKCPIVPGIMPIQSYPGFKKMTGFCKTKVPQEISDALEPIKDDPDAVLEYGIQLIVDMCKKIKAAGVCQGFHFYSLNKEYAVTKIVEELGLIKKGTAVKKVKMSPKGGETVAPKPAEAGGSSSSFVLVLALAFLAVAVGLAVQKAQK